MLDLQREFDRLNELQKECVLHDGNTVVLAGPGSGKTATLVVKVAHLLSDIVQPPRGVACITFNNDAVREFSSRLRQHGIYSGFRLYLGSVHSFCLNCVLRPYARLIYPRFRDGIAVAGPKRAESILDKALSVHMPGTRAAYYTSTLTKLRRTIACGEDTTGFDDRDPQVLREYQRILASEKLVDFEEMVILSLQLIRKNVWIRELLRARFPWLVIDEYQDLGGPLHMIATTLIESAGINVFAVGDPDQSIYDFTGADPKYLVELSRRNDFKLVRLKFNYRSGQRLIDASQAALSPDEPRDYRSDPKKKDMGEVFFKKAKDDVSDHAETTLQVIKEALGGGAAPEEVAVFYQNKNVLLAELRSEFTKAGVPFNAERDSSYPGSPIVRWLQNAASWSLGSWLGQEQLFEDLVRQYASLLAAANRNDAYSIPLDCRTSLYRALTTNLDPDASLISWLLKTDAELGVSSALSQSDEHADDNESLEALFGLAGEGGSLAHLKVRDFANDGRISGKVVLTTFHSSKGRQFDIVVIPGCVEGILPQRTWNRRTSQYDEPSGFALQRTRRLFYVGFTRARKAVYLVYSPGYVNQWGYPVQLGVSRFAREINKRLREG